MSNSKTFNLVLNCLVATMYVVMSYYSPSLFKAVQFRPSELLAVLPFFLPNVSVGVVVGCFVTNLGSDFGLIDIVFGTLSTAFTVYFVSKSKKLIFATLTPVFFSSMIGVIIFIGSGFSTFEQLFVSIVWVMVCEFFTTVVIGYPLYKALQNTNVFKILIKSKHIN